MKLFFKHYLFLIGLFFCGFFLQSQTHTPRVPSVQLKHIGGFYEYLPSAYLKDTTKNFPLIIMNHGSDKIGDGTTDIYKLLNPVASLTRYCDNGTFPDTFLVNGTYFSFIVLSPQYSGWPSAEEVDAFIEYAKNTYRIDTTRIYLTGLSMGGGIVWDYVKNNTRHADKIAAIAPVCGASNPFGEEQNIANITSSNVVTWAFHCDNDFNVWVGKTDEYIRQINYNNSSPNPLSKKTIYSGCGHTAWVQAYKPSYRENGLNMYEWLLTFAKDTLPCHSAVNLKNIEVTANSTTVAWDATDCGEYIVRYKKVSDTTWSYSPTLQCNSFVITNLDTNVEHEWSVKTLCSNTNSNYSYTIKFSTSADCIPDSKDIAYERPVETSYLNSLHSDSNIVDNSFYTYWESANIDTQWVTIDLGCPKDICKLTIRWDFFPQAYSIQTSLDKQNWTTIQSFNSSSSFDQIDNINSIASYVRIYMTSRSVETFDTSSIYYNNKAPYKMTDLHIYGNLNKSFSNCINPIGLYAGDITATSVNLNWDKVSDTTTYIVQYMKETDSVWHILSHNWADTTYPLSNLEPEKEYYFKIISNCDSCYSTFDYQHKFKTNSIPNTCGISNDLTVSNVGTSSAVLNWNSVTGANGYFVEYKADTSSVWISQAVVAITSYSLNGLSADTKYNFRISTLCSVGNSIPSSITSFTTSISTSINPIYSITKVSIWPNPVVSDLTVFTEDDAQVTIYDNLARIIDSRKILKGKTILQLSSLPSGVYHLQIVSNKKEASGKFIKIQ